MSNELHGCKWLDEGKRQPNGSGYCCMVVRSKTKSNRVRRPDMERCERYKAGDWKTRWESESAETA